MERNEVYGLTNSQQAQENMEMKKNGQTAKLSDQQRVYENPLPMRNTSLITWTSKDIKFYNAFCVTYKQTYLFLQFFQHH